MELVPETSRATQHRTRGGAPRERMPRSEIVFYSVSGGIAATATIGLVALLFS